MSNNRNPMVAISIKNNAITACVMSGKGIVKAERAEADASGIPEAIRSIAAGTGIKRCTVVIGQDSVKTVFEPLKKEGRITHEKLMLNIPYEFRDIIGPAELPSYCFDYMADAVGGEGKDSQIEVFPSAVRKAYIAQLERHVKNAGLNPVSVITEDENYSRIIKSAYGQGSRKPVCFISLNESLLEIRFFKGCIPVFTHGEDITMNTPYEEMADIISRALDQFAERTGGENAGIDTYITGEYADDSGFREVLQAVSQAFVLKNFASLLPDMGSGALVSSYASVLGACLGIPGNGKLAASRQMNMHVETREKKKPGKALVPVAVVIVLAFFAWIGVYRPIQDKNEKEHELSMAQQELTEKQALVASFDGLRSEYVHYYRDYETKDEQKTLDRTSCLNIIKYYVFPYVTVTSVNMNGNEMTISAENSSMQTISKLINRLNKLDFVEYAVPSSSASDDSADIKDDTISASTQFRIVLKPSQEVLEKGINEKGQINSEAVKIEAGENGDDAEYIIIEETETMSENTAVSSGPVTGRIISDDEEIYRSGQLSNDELAWQVIRGKWANEQERWDSLAAAGYSAADVQALVDEICNIYGFGTDTSQIGGEVIDSCERDYYDNVKKEGIR